MNATIEHINALLARIEALEKRIEVLEKELDALRNKSLEYVMHKLAFAPSPWMQLIPQPKQPLNPPPQWYEPKPIYPREDTGWPLPAGPTCVNCPPSTKEYL